MIELRLSSLAMPLNYSADSLKAYIAERYGIKESDVAETEIIKKSVDARKRNNIVYSLNVIVRLKRSYPHLAEYINNGRRSVTLEEYLLPYRTKTGARPLVIGAGPAGLFAALSLAIMGYKPIVADRGAAIEDRIGAVDAFVTKGILDAECNVQFGEGGAGTFSDGKLNTGVDGEMAAMIIDTLIEAGADKEIKYSSRPHIGTDKLREIIPVIRKRIISLGGEFRFNTRVDDFIVNCGSIRGVKTACGKVIDCVGAILAIGHSARDTYKKLFESGAAMERKPFSIGLRIEHSALFISRSRYGDAYAELPPADYKMAAKLKDGRTCYTFCMCPGGVVIPSSSEYGGVVVNGMSYSARDKQNSNSAVLVSVEPRDFGTGGVLAGVDFQRRYERAAYSDGFVAPVEKVNDFTGLGEGDDTVPSYRPGVRYCKLASLLPDFVSAGIKEGLKEFDRKIKGFASRGILTGVETRSSAPLRILRGAGGESSICGLYPCGEGAGYAGGITSSAIDGVKAAIALFKNNF